MKSIRGYKLLSKAGKESSNRYKILGEKDKILNSSTRKKDSYTLYERKKQPLIVELFKDPEKIETREKNLTQTKIDQKLSPNHIIQNSIKIKISKSKNASADSLLSSRDYYSPSYTAQDKHIRTIKFNHSIIQKKKTTEKVYKAHQHPNTMKLHESQHIASGISFKKQLPRNSLWIHNNLNEKRFDFSPVLHSQKSAPDFNKQTSRPLLYKVPEYFPDYDPKKEKILKKISYNILFDKFLKREVIKRQKVMPDAYDINFTYIDPKPKYCKIK
jgi:hypothetical protein